MTTAMPPGREPGHECGVQVDPAESLAHDDIEVAEVERDAGIEVDHLGVDPIRHTSRRCGRRGEIDRSIGRIDRDHVEAVLGEPDRLATGTARDVERAPGGADDVDQAGGGERVGRRWLGDGMARVAGVPAVSVVGGHQQRPVQWEGAAAETATGLGWLRVRHLDHLDAPSCASRR